MKTKKKNHYFYPVESQLAFVVRFHPKPPQTKGKEKYKVKNERNVSVCVCVCFAFGFAFVVYTIEAFMIHIFEKISLEYI